LKTAFDETLKKCFDHSSAYVEAIPSDDVHENMRLEAELKCESLKNKRYEYGVRFAMFVQECTDQEGPASQISSRKSLNSGKSSSLASRQRELFELECAKFAMESRQLLAETKAKIQADLEIQKAQMDSKIAEVNLAAQEATLNSSVASPKLFCGPNS